MLLCVLHLAAATAAATDTVRWRREMPVMPDFASAVRRAVQERNGQLKPGQSPKKCSGAPRSSSKVEQLVDDATNGDEAWSLKAESEGVRVWRRSMPDSTFDMVRGSAVLDVEPHAVVKLFETTDEELIRQFNPLYDSGWDLERIDHISKVAYARVRSAFPGVKPRDTVTRVSHHMLGQRGDVFLLRAVEHRGMPPQRGCVRAKILNGMNLVQPVPGNNHKTNFTFTQQTNPGGIVPAWIANRLIAREAVQFVQRIGAVAKSLEK